MNNAEVIKSIFVVIVVYGEHIENSTSYKSLVSSLQPDELENLDLLIYDNSPEIHYVPSAIALPHCYIHNPSNPGLSAAYNTALKLACEKNKQWLLLLDDDTTISREFLISTFRYASVLNTDNDVVAIVPEIQTKNHVVVSPCRMTHTSLFIPFTVKTPHILKGRVSALNSGALLKIEFLSDIKGFSNDFPLDMLDHWVFRQIYLSNKRVFSHDKVIIHDLSVFSDEYMDKIRYSEKFLPAERRFFQEENRFTSFFYNLNLLLRSIEQLTKGKKEIARLTWKAFLNKNNCRNQ